MCVDLSGRKAIVTGGSKGYGAGIAEVLKESGVEVWITGRDEAVLAATAKRVGVHPIRADVTSPADWDRVFKQVLSAANRLDILVNNAGAGIRIAPLAEQTDDEIAQGIAVNLTGVIYGARRAAKVMSKQKSGSIINVSSVCARQAWPGFSVYSAAKAGLALLSDCLYTELRDSGVRVTTLIPSWGATQFAKAANLPERPAEEAAKCIQPRELGTIVRDLCALPAHLTVQDLTVWPMIQEAVPL